MATFGSTGTDQYAAVVYNPSKVDRGRLQRSVDAAQAAAGWGATLWFETSLVDPGQQAARRALRQGASVVIAAGGDGTVRAVTEALRGSGVRLAIIPTGTGNLFARNLELPLGNLDAAAQIAFGGAERTIDVGVASITTEDGKTTDHSFLVVAGVGLDAEMIARTRSAAKKQMGWLAYVGAGVRVIPTAKPFRIGYSLSGSPERQAHISTVLIANCGMLPGNVPFLPDAKLDDGVLDIAIVQPKGVLGWLMIWRRVTWENGVLRRSAAGRRIIRRSASMNERIMTTLNSPDIRITMEKPQPVELDGDALGIARSVFARADPSALIVRVR
ncbi:MAG: diacylglycerol kinase family protein [Cryobacterium sp.]